MRASDFARWILVMVVLEGFIVSGAQQRSPVNHDRTSIQELLDHEAATILHNSGSSESESSELPISETSGLDLNNQPIIGILTQPIDREEYDTYIMAAYVKFIEQAGARVVPINTQRSDENILELISHLNGVLYPGGGVNLILEDGTLTEFSRKGKLILDRIKEYNDNGIHYPVWAVCMGFQEISVIEAPEPDTLLKRYFDSYNYANNVTFKTDPRETKLYENIPEYLLEVLQTENVTFNSHHDGVLPATYAKYPGLQEYTVIADSFDNNGIEYVATVEHKKYPIWGVQYHPEKNAFIWKQDLVVPHTEHAVELEQYYAKFFVNEAKKNSNSFPDDASARQSLIENYTIEFTSGEIQDIYLFKRDD